MGNLFRAIAILLLSSASLFGQTWTGAAGDGDWNNALNWNPPVVPNSISASPIFGANGAGTITLSNSVSIGSINFDTSTSFNLAPVTAQTLTLSAITLTSATSGTQTINTSLFVAGGTNLSLINNSTVGGSLVLGTNSVLGRIGSGTSALAISGAGNIIINASSASSSTINGGFTKAGSGALIMTGNFATATGSSMFAGGSLTLDYSGNATPTYKLPTGSITLSSIDVTLRSHPSASWGEDVQSPTTFAGGATSILVLTNGGGSAPIDLFLRNVTRNAGATADFRIDSNGRVLISSPLTNGIIGGWATFGGGDNWATKTGNVVVPFTAYSNNVFASGTQTQVTSASLPAGFTTNSLRFNIPSSGTTSVIFSGISTIESGGILVAFGSAPLLFTGGTISSSTGELIVHPNNTLTIDSKLVLPAGLTKGGFADLTLTNGANDFGGSILHIARGGLKITNPGAVNSAASIQFDNIRAGATRSQTFTTDFGSGVNGTLSVGIQLSASAYSAGEYPNVFTTGSSINSRVTLTASVTSTPGQITPVQFFSSTGSGYVVGANTFRGDVSIAGLLSINSDTSFGDASNTIYLAGDLELRSTNIGITHKFKIGGGRIVDTAVGVNTISGLIDGTGTLTKAGPGTLVLTAINPRTGTTVIESGTLRIAADGNLGSSTALLSINSSATIDFTETTTTNRAIQIGSTSGTGAAVVNVASGKTVTFNGSIIDQSGIGSLKKTGGGTLSLTKTSSTYSGGTSIEDGQVLAAGDGALGLAGTPVSVQPIAKLTITATSESSRTFTIVAGLIQNNAGNYASGGGIRNGTVIVDYAGKAKGTGYYEAVLTQNGGAFSPGNSPGNAQQGTTFLNSGGVLNIDIDAAGTNSVGSPGQAPGWGRVQTISALRISATPASKFTITLTSQQLGAASVAGPVSNFDATKPYHWEVIQMQPGASLFNVSSGGPPMDPSAYVWDPNIVTVDTQSFQNPLAGGTFSTSFDLNSVSTYSVYVNFAPNPVPEPAAILGLSAVALCLGSYLRRRNKTTNRMACPVAVRNAFTLLELIVVIAILGVIISLVLPAIQKVRNEGQNLNCQSNLKNIGIAVHQHHDGSIPSDWAEKALPFFDQATLSEMDPNEAGKIPLPIYSCPSAGVPQVFDSGLAAGHYVQNTSVTNLTIAQITAGDGTTVTLMHSEEKAPAAWIISREMSELNLLSWHSKGANGLFCDGHVQFLNDRLDLRIRNQLLNPADGGPVAEDLR